MPIKAFCRLYIGRLNRFSLFGNVFAKKAGFSDSHGFD
jgi:hypothetical protein